MHVRWILPSDFTNCDGDTIVTGVGGVPSACLDSDVFTKDSPCGFPRVWDPLAMIFLW